MKKVLIIDEDSFSRICSALLEEDGHKTEILEDINSLVSMAGGKEFGLLITSYPFCHSLFERIKKMSLPTIVLTDHLNRTLINFLEESRNSYCMVKPLDYQKFRSVVKQIVKGEQPNEGLNIL
ncbi:MAG: DNA-binding response regulator [Nitrospirae bacterium]|nr:DNA-binding response regulator [Nitrospirota bacterium]